MIKKIWFLFALNYPAFISAQLHVRDEPRHHHVFENEFIRILDARIAPGDTTQYHLHNTPSVFITLTNSKVGSQLEGGEPQKGANISGLAMYDELATPRVHRVWNEDTSWFHVMDVECIAKQPKHKVSLLNATTLKLKDDAIHMLFNEKLVTAYKLTLSKDQTTGLPPSGSGYLLVSIADAVIQIAANGSTQHRNMRQGHYVWIDGKAAVNISAKAIAGFILLQLK